MDRQQGEVDRSLVVRAAAGAVGATIGLAGPDAAVLGAGVAPLVEQVLGRIVDTWSQKRTQRVTETLQDAAHELGGDTTENLQRLVEVAASDEVYQELLARALTIAQDTAMRDKRRALGRALANALEDTGTKVDDEIAWVRMLGDLDPVHIRVLRIMNQRPRHLDQVALTMNAGDDPKAVRRWYAWSLTEADPGLEGSVRGALRALEQHGLIWDHGETPVPPPNGLQHEYEISEHGEYLLARLGEPTA